MGPLEDLGVDFVPNTRETYSTPLNKTKSQNLYDQLQTSKRDTKSLRFPSDLGREGTDNIIRFNVNVPSGSKYLGNEAGNRVLDVNGNEVTSQRRRRENGSLASRFSENVVRTDTVIDLFLPPSIQTKYSSNWNTTSLGNTGAAIDAAFGVGGGEGGYDSIAQAMRAVKNTLSTAIPNVGTKVLDTIARTNTEGARQAITSTATNPYMEVLFEGINPRTFAFTFKMIPRNQQEQITINNIIKQFKFHQAPEIKYEGQSNYWIFPSEFDITYLYKGQENPWIHRVSTCALTDVDVEYTAEGQYSSLRDGSPFSTTLTLSFTEMELIDKARVLEGY